MKWEVTVDRDSKKNADNIGQEHDLRQVTVQSLI